jgi:hypothetical protein
MKIKNRNFFIAVFITILAEAFIFLINNSNAELGASFGIYVKLEFARYFAIATGMISILSAVILTVLKRREYTSMLIYIFPGVLNSGLGIFGLVYYWFTNNKIALHEFLISLLIGIIILSDVFLFKVD